MIAEGTMVNQGRSPNGIDTFKVFEQYLTFRVLLPWFVLNFLNLIGLTSITLPT